MDQILVDVSALPEVAVGMQATLLGTQGAESITAWDLASQADTIPWEILTNIGTRVRRYTVG
jgi:alanine racemase